MQSTIHIQYTIQIFISIMHKLQKLPISKTLLQYPIFLLSNSEKQDPQIETVSFKKNVINDFTKIAFESQKKLQFVNGKALVYQNKRSLSTIIGQACLYLVPMAGIGYLIYTNPFASFFPAAIPILAFFELVIMKLWLNRIKWNQNIVSQIYLLESGQASQIWFANKTKRKLFGQQLNKIYYNSIFVNPDFEGQQIIIANKQNELFPQSMNQATKQKSTGYAWVKYFSNGENFLVIPKQAEIINMRILVELFKGKIIKTKIK